MAATRTALMKLPRWSARSLHSSAAAPSSSALLPRKVASASSSASSSIARTSQEAARLTAITSTTSLSKRFASGGSKPQEMTVRDALNSAMEEEMLRDDNVFLLGEEVARCEYSVFNFVCRHLV
jgi:pyruvate dehydrogenase E1 component beta subunit